MTMLMTFARAGEVLVPADDDAMEWLESRVEGEVFVGEFRVPRNLGHHRKFFAMLKVGFEAWEPPPGEFRGIPAVKNFVRFRKDVTIQAGYYDVVSNLRGEVRAEAKSISFAAMEQSEFEAFYSACADVLLRMVLTHYERADLDCVVNQMVGFV